jgi:glycolate oxidase iron-sulfur subunit
MQHTIPLTQLAEQMGAQAGEMARAVATCVHCGFCLPVCPTYQVLGQEIDSPRGRIFLMRAVLEGELPVEEAKLYIDRCLGCLSCASTCPSGVRYGDLLMPFRAYIQENVSLGFMEQVQRTLLNETIPYPTRFRTAAGAGRLASPFLKILPDELKSMLSLVPERLPTARPLPKIMPAEGERRARVALLVGCVQQVLAPEINWATLRVLAKNGVEVIIPPEQTCCGAVLMHTGERAGALRLARQNLKAFPEDVDAILTNAAGCGSGLKEYGLLFKGHAEEEQAEAFLRCVQDVSQFLARLGMREPPPLLKPLKIAYHDACHLAHAQGIIEAPRLVLKAIPNLTLFEVNDGAMCCGSAGTYNIEQPEIANELGKRKVNIILKLGSEAVVMGNIGCMVQIRAHLRLMGESLPVLHTFELLDLAYSQIRFC